MDEDKSEFTLQNPDEPILLDYAPADEADVSKLTEIVRVFNDMSVASFINVFGTISIVLIFIDMMNVNYGSASRLPLLPSWLCGFIVVLAIVWALAGGLLAFLHSVNLLVKLHVHPLAIAFSILTIFIFPFTFIVPPALLANIFARVYFRRRGIKVGMLSVRKDEFSKMISGGKENSDQ